MISLTEKAISHVKSLIADNDLDGFGLRVAISAGGCSGYSYILDVVDDVEEDDFVFDVEGLPVYCDPKSHSFVDGIIIDYESSLMGGGFKFDNPKAKRSCGCGTSFQVTEEAGCG